MSVTSLTALYGTREQSAQQRHSITNCTTVKGQLGPRLVVRPENSCSLGQVVMMQTLSGREFDDMARCCRVHRSPMGCVHAQ